MAANGISDKTTVRLPMAVFVGILIACTSGAFSAVIATYTSREALKSEIRAERLRELKNYVTVVDWLNWREQNHARADQQFYELSSAIGELKREVENRFARSAR